MFQFKQFSIKQSQTAMKVGTDGVLLGAWSCCQNPQNILDIGCGTGLIAIMLAQKYPTANIYGVEINSQASQQAQQNAANCKWSEIIKIYNSDFIEFAEKTNKKFDLIVSNPPFFENHLQNTDKDKTIARHNDLLPFDKLIKGVKKIMTNDANFDIILPYSGYRNFEHLCSKNLLFCNKKIYVRHTEKKEIKRILMRYSNKITNVAEEILTLKENGNFTEQYKLLTKEFYLFL